MIGGAMYGMVGDTAHENPGGNSLPHGMLQQVHAISN
jgi:hypothetical protein